MNSLEEVVDQSKTSETESPCREKRKASAIVPSPSLYSLLPAHLAHHYQAIPLAIKDRSLTLGCAQLLTPEIVEKLQFATDYFIDQVLLPQEKITDLLTCYEYSHFNTPCEEVIAGESCADVGVSPLDGNSILSETVTAEEAPVVRYVNMLLDEAIQKEASDLHLESFETECRIRYRIDGVLRERKSLSLTLAESMISRLKLLAHLDITERRLPQDGRLQHTWNKTTIDFRLSALPTQFGESVVLRLLDRRNIVRDLSSLQLPSFLYRSINQLLEQPHGLFIVTGPTGAGKTTTLYACLQKLKARGLKLLTAEDPVEYEIEGIMQIPIHDAIGRTFQRVLRSSLRHDPDVIMIGETRDRETAHMAMQASLTGHLVLTSLHTNDAAGAISRLIDMGIDPLMISTTLEGVLAQRLVRKICLSCRAAYSAEHFSPSEVAFFNNYPLPQQLEPAFKVAEADEGQEVDGATQPFAASVDFKDGFLYRGLGCELCHQSGYQGRIGIFELLLMDDELRLLIQEKVPHYQIQKKAIEGGMKTLHVNSLRLVLEGITTVEEILQTTIDC